MNDFVDDFQKNPGPLSVTEGHSNYHNIESDWASKRGEFDDIYVSFSGHFGSYGPHLFAAAPELKEFAEKVRDFARELDDDGLYAAAESVIAKAEGRE